MENVWQKVVNYIFQKYATIGCKFDVYQSCQAKIGLSFCWISF